MLSDDENRKKYAEKTHNRLMRIQQFQQIIFFVEKLNSFSVRSDVYDGKVAAGTDAERRSPEGKSA